MVEATNGSATFQYRRSCDSVNMFSMKFGALIAVVAIGLCPVNATTENARQGKLFDIMNYFTGIKCTFSTKSTQFRKQYAKIGFNLFRSR